MKKRIATILAMLFMIATLSMGAHAITTGRWDFEAGYRYAQKVAEEMATSMPENQMNMLHRAIAEQTSKVRAFWKN